MGGRLVVNTTGRLRKKAGTRPFQDAPTKLLTLGDGANKVSVRLAGLKS